MVRKIIISFGIALIAGSLVGTLTSKKRYFYYFGFRRIECSHVLKERNTLVENEYNLTNAFSFGILALGVSLVAFNYKK